MRTRFRSGTTIVAGALLLFAFARAEALVVVNDQGCLVHDGEGGVVYSTGADATVSHDGADLCVVTCETRLAAGVASPAVLDRSATGGSCGIQDCGFTEEWTQTIDADGSVTLVCDGTR